jgi:hypothetical protein
MSKHAGNTVEARDSDESRLNESLQRERRIGDRKTISIRATVTASGERTLAGHTVDLSRGGAAITVPFELTPGQECEITFDLEACGTSTGFHIPAEVRYCVPLGAGRFRVGVRFGHTDDATITLIAAVLN